MDLESQRQTLETKIKQLESKIDQLNNETLKSQSNKSGTAAPSIINDLIQKLLLDKVTHQAELKDINLELSKAALLSKKKADPGIKTPQHSLSKPPTQSWR
jgi:chromosome segregation ATPase